MSTTQNQLLILPTHAPKETARLKRDALINWIKSEDIPMGIIMCNQKDTIRSLVLSLSRQNIKARGMHNQMPPKNRDKNIKLFESMEVNFIICSDDAIEGIEVPCLPYVFNFDTPKSSDTFNNRKSIVDDSAEDCRFMSIISTSEIPILKNINDHLNISFNVIPTSAILPNCEDIPTPTFLNRNESMGRVKKEPVRRKEESFTVRKNRYRYGGGKHKYLNIQFSDHQWSINSFKPDFMNTVIKI